MNSQKRRITMKENETTIENEDLEILVEETVSRHKLVFERLDEL